MSVTTSTIKYFMVFFNSLCLLLGVTIILINSLALENADNFMMTSIVFMIPLAAIIVVISLLGCIGAICKNTIALWIYAALMLIVVMANLTLLLGFSSSVDVGERAELIVDAAWMEQLSGTDSMSFIQEEYGCCGKNSPEDYINAHLFIPESCYIGGNTTTIARDIDLYPEGCIFKLMEYYTSIEQLLSVFSWTTCSLECTTLIFACILAITFTNK